MRCGARHGGPARLSGAYHDTTNTAVGTTLAAPQGQIPVVTKTLYDGAGRTTATVMIANGVERWRSTTAYGGDRTHVTPPAGGTATTTITDVRGQVEQLRQYKNPADVGSADPAKFVATTYTSTLLGKLASVEDAAGNDWTYTYELRGRETQRTDPDNGTTTSTYDAAGNLLTGTSPLGTGTATLAYTYDEPGRRTTVRDDTVTGTIRAQWVYDTPPGGKGKLTSATRYVGGNACTTQTDTFDAYGRPTSNSVVLPASEGALCAAATPNICAYTTLTSYKANGKPFQVTLPAAADLASEKLTYGYTDVGEDGTLLPAGQIHVDAVTYSKVGLLTGRLKWTHLKYLGRATGALNVLGGVVTYAEHRNEGASQAHSITAGAASVAGGMAGAWAGARAGAAIGVWLGGPAGAVMGGAVGAAVGGLIGSGLAVKAVDKAWDTVSSWFS